MCLYHNSVFPNLMRFHIYMQVFIALLRTCQPENRMLVKQALDILMPALPRRLPPGDTRVPIWIRYTKKILVEEGHSIPNMIHIFQLIVRHSDLFYSCRAQFVPQMVNSLSRLGLPYNTTPENRRLAIELAGKLVKWSVFFFHVFYFLSEFILHKFCITMLLLIKPKHIQLTVI